MPLPDNWLELEIDKYLEKYEERQKHKPLTCSKCDESYMALILEAGATIRLCGVHYLEYRNNVYNSQ